MSNKNHNECYETPSLRLGAFLRSPVMCISGGAKTDDYDVNTYQWDD